MALLGHLDRAAASLGFAKKAPARRHMRGPAIAAVGLLTLDWVIGLAMPESSGAAAAGAFLMMVAIIISSWVSLRGPLGLREEEPKSDLVKAAYWRAIAQACLIILALLMLGVFGVAIGTLTLSSSIASRLILSLVVLQGALPALVFSLDVGPTD